MFKARKRPNQQQPDSNSIDTNDSAQFGSKRVMPSSPCDFNRAEPSRVAEQPSLNPQRAESSQQHARALNIQLASWVQSQLQNHPDELWEDGVQDYLNHASHILDNFRDVVDWLKANAAKSSEPLPGIGPSNTWNESIFGSKPNELKFQLPEKSGVAEMGSTQHGTETESVPSTKNNELKFQLPETSGIVQMGSSSGFAKSWSSDSTPYSTESGSIFGTKSNELKFQLPVKNSIAQVGSSFGSSWSSSPAFTNQTPFSSGLNMTIHLDMGTNWRLFGQKRIKLCRDWIEELGLWGVAGDLLLLFYIG